MRILLVEDEKRLSAAICQLLKQEHFETDAVYNGTDGLDYAMTEMYDAVILDVMLPGMDGFTVLKKMRAEGVNTPVLMLTARGDLEDRVRGLETGADYYLPKPFEKSELVACLRAITRRKEDVMVQELTFGDLQLDEKSAGLRCMATGKEIKLGAKEYQLMEIFMRNSDQILPKELLIERVWGFDSEAEYNNLEVYISFLRKKIGFTGSSVRCSLNRYQANKDVMSGQVRTQFPATKRHNARPGPCLVIIMEIPFGWRESIIRRSVYGLQASAEAPLCAGAKQQSHF